MADAPLVQTVHGGVEDPEDQVRRGGALQLVADRRAGLADGPHNGTALVVRVLAV
eukprot:CAMPEP_0194719798 /NCGR_PEP_ID=MMETSP0296-20130528/11202_1 /TAXON_ID=39354 /ORGANISM="Heterosigma akashiwo, Strain CCMP2393" /LENGTH=54 /DNA_ID=CAMNT_0039621691 /DNA_START=487 /DNA_END=651 /DNA_ORIENTATION=-